MSAFAALSLLLKILFFPFKAFFHCLWSVVRRKNDPPDYSCDIVLITGGAQGLGRELSLHFSDCGATVILWDINESKLRQTVSEITAQGRETFGYVVDCSNKEQIYQTAERVREEVGNVSILVNNVGMLPGKLITEFKDGEFERTINVNFLSHYWTIHCFLPWMLKNNYGQILEIASVAAFVGTPFTTDYSASKAGLVNFCESLHYELLMAGKKGVKVTCVCPSLIATELVSSGRAGAMANHVGKGQIITVQYAADLIFKGFSEKKFLVFIPSHVGMLMSILFFLPKKIKNYFIVRTYKPLFENLEEVLQ